MASRRPRIKGLVNIPARRKAAVAEEEVKVEDVKAEVEVKDEENSVQDEANVEVGRVVEAKIARRKILKPKIKVESIKRKVGGEVAEAANENENQAKIVVLDNVCMKSPDVPAKVFPLPEKSNILPIPANISNSPADKGITRLTPHIYSTTSNGSDLEYPPPPLSPSKINRSRIKAIPKLSHRKTSFSASESEDESKRQQFNRIRNDSVCSTASGVPESISDCFSPQRPKEQQVVPKKVTRVSEQNRKIANARFDFYVRFGHNKPNRDKLTMMDLIFYNPTTNPMSSNSKSRKNSIAGSTSEETKTEEAEINAVEAEIEPKPPSEDEEEEDAMPVPQVKLNQAGEIVIDEQSLFIESKGTKKRRKEIESAPVINGDTETGYGIYKRAKRSKDWTQSETLRFYKALNSIGTDFSLMCEVFPRRTRRELKLKFKKEEKINKKLIDRAVLEPVSYNYAELKHDMEMEEKEFKELERQKEVDEARKQKRATERKRKDMQVQDETADPDDPPKRRKWRRIKKRSFIVTSPANSEADISDADSESVSSLKQTRSGRVPKLTQKYNSDSIETENTEGLEPGSLMLMSNENAEGEAVVQLYIVAPDQQESGPMQNIINISATEVLNSNGEANVTISEEGQ